MAPGDKKQADPSRCYRLHIREKPKVILDPRNRGPQNRTPIWRVGGRFWFPRPKLAEQTPPTLYFFESSFQALSNARIKKFKKCFSKKIWATKGAPPASKIAVFHENLKNEKDRMRIFWVRGAGRCPKNFCRSQGTKKSV